MFTLRQKISDIPYTLGNLILPPATGRPVFVTGNGRSGTSWIGEMLGFAPNVLYYREPCHPRRNGMSLDSSEQVWSKIVPENGQDIFFERTLSRAFRGHFWRGCGFSLTDYPNRATKSPRIVVKEVASFASTEWVYKTWFPEVLVIMRHPGAYAESVKKLHQGPSEVARLELLAANPVLMSKYKDMILNALSHVNSAVDASIVAWAIRTRVYLDAKAHHPDWHLVHYENIALAPVEQMKKIYSALNLGWDEDVEARILATTTNDAKGSYSTSRMVGSRIDAWRTDLPEETRNLARHTLEIFEIPFYRSTSDWQ
ncbi:MAG: sulfotransferase [Pseudomonadota bacterium]